MFGLTLKRKDKIRVTTLSCAKLDYIKFVCIEDEEINPDNIYEKIEKVVKEHQGDVFYEFQRTPKGFCGIVGTD